MPLPNRMTVLLALGGSLLSLAPPAHAHGSNWRAYEAAVIGGGYAAGEEIGANAVGGGYDGGAPTGTRGGPGPADRPCFVRRPVYNSQGTLIGYRGQQLC
jgi:hypothetical protein